MKRTLRDLPGARDRYQFDPLAAYLKSRSGKSLHEVMSALGGTSPTAELGSSQVHSSSDYGGFLRSIRDQARVTARDEVAREAFVIPDVPTPNLLTFLQEQIRPPKRKYPYLNRIGRIGLSSMRMIANLDSGPSRGVQLDYEPSSENRLYARVMLYPGTDAINVQAFEEFNGEYSNLVDVPGIHEALTPDIIVVAEHIVAAYGISSHKSVPGS